MEKIGVKSERDLDELSLAFEHLVNDNCNEDVHADLFRGCLTDNNSPEIQFRLGMVFAYIHTALKQLDLKEDLGSQKKDVVKSILDKMLTDRSYQLVVDALNELLNNGLTC